MWQFIEDDSTSRWHCELLDTWPHGFFTRRANEPLPERLAVRLGLNGPAYQLRQIHSALVHSTPLEPFIEGDSLWTESTGSSVWVRTADCVPILLADPARGAVAAIHAGWRGTAKQILPRTIEAFQRAGSRSEDLLCALGPAISGAVYQVAQCVAAEVTGMVEAPDRAILRDPDPGRVRLDVREVNRQQAIGAGIRPDQVVVCPVCTYGEPERLFSYRREGGGKVQYSGIGL